MSSSNPVPIPSATVGAPDSSTMVGGGAFNDYGIGPGNMLFASYPSNKHMWSASGKAHEEPSNATLTVYAIGVTNMEDPSLP